MGRCFTNAQVHYIKIQVSWDVTLLLGQRSLVFEET